MPLEEVQSSIGLFSTNTIKMSAWRAFQKLHSLDKEGTWRDSIGVRHELTRFNKALIVKKKSEDRMC